MALQSSGTISLSQVQTEFTGANPISMSEYYKNGPYVPSTVGGAAGAWSGYTYTASTRWIREVTGSYGYLYLYWAGTLVYSGDNYNATQLDSLGDGYDFGRGNQYSYQGADKNNPTETTIYYIRRRTTATSVTVNTSIPASGTISMSQFYGGRKT